MHVQARTDLTAHIVVRARSSEALGRIPASARGNYSHRPPTTATTTTWIVFNSERRQAGIGMRRHRLLLLLLSDDLSLQFLLLLGVRGVVVSGAPARVQLHVKLLLFARHLVVFRLLGASKRMPLHTYRRTRRNKIQQQKIHSRGV